MSADPKPGNLSIPVHLGNPGHFLACCGILYMADRMFDVATGYFDNECFVLQTNHGGNPVTYIIEQVSMLKIQSISEDRDSPIKLKGGTETYLDFWNHFDDRPITKLFTGNQKSKKIISRWHEELKKINTGGKSDIFKISTKELPSGFDTSTAYSALDVGFSLNAHKMNKKMITYPIVEFFAHIGTQMFGYKKDGGSYSYNVWKQPLSIQIAMAVAAGALELTRTQRFVAKTKKSGNNHIFIQARRNRLD